MKRMLFGLFLFLFFWMGWQQQLHLGLYHPSAGIYGFLYFGILAAGCYGYRSNRFSSLVVSDRWIALGVAIIIARFMYWVSRDPKMLYPLNENALLLFKQIGKGVFGSAVLIVVLLCLPLRWVKFSKIRLPEVIVGLCVFSCLSLFVCQILVTFISPNPGIDVFISNQAASDFLLNFKNPYAQVYRDIYNGAYGYKPGLMYFPGIALLQAPFRALFGDVRLSFVLAQIITAFFIYRLSCLKQVSRPLSALMSFLWLTFPITYHVMEQAWIDFWLCAFFSMGIYYTHLCKKSWGKASWAGAFMGLAFSVKQVGVFFPFLGWLEAMRSTQLFREKKALALTYAVSGVLAFGAVVLPFLLISPQDFLGMTVMSHVEPGYRKDAYNLTVFLGFEYGWWLPGWLNMVGLVVAVLISTVFRIPAALSAMLIYGIGFLLGKYCFANYHYLLAFFCLMAMIDFLDQQKNFGSMPTERWPSG